MAYCEKMPMMSGCVITAKQMFLCSRVCNLVLKTGPDATVLTVTNGKFNFCGFFKIHKKC